MQLEFYSSQYWTPLTEHVLDGDENWIKMLRGLISSFIVLSTLANFQPTPLFKSEKFRVQLSLRRWLASCFSLQRCPFRLATFSGKRSHKGEFQSPSARQNQIKPCPQVALLNAGEWGFPASKYRFHHLTSWPTFCQTLKGSTKK